jgi:hypothetical protein
MKFDPKQNLTNEEITNIFKEFFSYVPLVSDTQKDIIKEKLPTIYKYLVEDELSEEEKNLNSTLSPEDKVNVDLANGEIENPFQNISKTEDSADTFNTPEAPSAPSIKNESISSLIEDNKKLEQTLIEEQEKLDKMQNDSAQ